MKRSGGGGGFAFGSKYVGQVAQLANKLEDVKIAPESDSIKAAIIPADLDGELTQQLQRLSKRDPTTRLKALQALRTLIPEKGASAAKPALPFWAYHFPRLCMDSNRSVRAEAFSVMSSLAASIGRDIAPIVKSVVPYWWMGRFDAAPEVVAAAKTGFEESFPGSKSYDALLFAQAEVCQVLQSHMNSTPQSLESYRNEAPEEREERHSRVLASTAAALGTLTRLVANEASLQGKKGSKELETGIQAILEKPTLYKALLKSKIGMVRGSAYSLISTLCTAEPAWLSGIVSDVAPLVLGGFADKDPGNHAAIWEAVISLAKTYPECWSHVNISKAFLPRLWSFLRHACYGSAETSYLAVFPLLMVMPLEIINSHFITSLLDNVWQGGIESTMGQAQRAAAACFQESLLFFLIKAAGFVNVPNLEPRYVADQLAVVMPPRLFKTALGSGNDATLVHRILQYEGEKLEQYSTKSAATSPWLPIVVQGYVQFVGSSLAAAIDQTLNLNSTNDSSGIDPGAMVSSEKIHQLITSFKSQGALVAAPIVAVLMNQGAQQQEGQTSSSSTSLHPQATTLLTTLLKVFPDLEVEAHGASPMDLDTVLQQVLDMGEQDWRSLQAGCDLLACCVVKFSEQAHVALMKVMSSLINPASGRAAVKTALMVLESLRAGHGGAVKLETFRSNDLDSLAIQLCDSSHEILSSAGKLKDTLSLINLLLEGRGEESLLTPSGQKAVLGHLRNFAVDALSKEDCGGAAIQVLQTALFSPALVFVDVKSARVELLEIVYHAFIIARVNAALRQVRHDNEQQEHDDGDDSEDESIESPDQSNSGMEALWANSLGIHSIVESLPTLKQQNFVRNIISETCMAIEELTSTMAAGPNEWPPVLRVLASSFHLVYKACEDIKDDLQAFLLNMIASQIYKLMKGDNPKISFVKELYAVFAASLAATVGYSNLLIKSVPEGITPAEFIVDILCTLALDDMANEQLQAMLQYLSSTSEEGVLKDVLREMYNRVFTVLSGIDRHEDGNNDNNKYEDSMSLELSDEKQAYTQLLHHLLERAVACNENQAGLVADFFADTFITGAAYTSSENVRILQTVALPAVAAYFRASKSLLTKSQLDTLSIELCKYVLSTEEKEEATSVDPSDVVVDARPSKWKNTSALIAAIAQCFPCRQLFPTPPPINLTTTTTISNATNNNSNMPSTSTQYEKGAAVWYQHRTGHWEAGEIVSIDISITPPSYGVKLLESAVVRETEGSRLNLRIPGTGPPPSLSSSLSSSTSAAHDISKPAVSAVAREYDLADQGFEASLDETTALIDLFTNYIQPINGATPLSLLDPPAAAALLQCTAGYCWRQLSKAQWLTILDTLPLLIGSCVEGVRAIARSIADAVVVAARQVAGVAIDGPELSVQFLRRLLTKGVLNTSARAQAALNDTAAAISLGFEQLQDHMAVLSSVIQTYCHVSAAIKESPQVSSLIILEWERAQAAVCFDTLKVFLAFGSIVALAASTATASALDKLSSEYSSTASTWEMLAGVAQIAVRSGDADFLLTVWQDIDSQAETTGIDTVDAVLALALNESAPPTLQAAAYDALLQHTELLKAVSDAAINQGEDLESLDAEASGTSVSALQALGVRHDLLLSIQTPSHPSYFTAWALLIAHILALPSQSPGRSLLVQALKEDPELVASALNSLLPLLPIQTSSASSSSVSSQQRKQQNQQQQRSSSAASLKSPSSSVTGTGSSDNSTNAVLSTQVILQCLGRPDTVTTATGVHIDEVSLSSQLHRVAPILYAGMLRALPASCRMWFSDLRDKSTVTSLEKFTSERVSPQLLAEEFTAVTELASTAGPYDKFSVRANPASKEVVAVMTVEDGQVLELVIKLPACMPLKAPQAECRRSVGVPEGRLRKWLLSITAFLRNQNGAVAGAISLWERNIENEFEGQEDCLICYSIIQASTGRLPQLACRTCSKRFHGACLYKWFNSSGKSNCPHCQSAW